MSKKMFEWPVRIYYEDTDCARVVYYANYLKFFERARTEWLRSLGWDQERMFHELGMLYVVANIEARYHKPAKLDDALIVRTCIDEFRTASLTFIQEIWREKELLVSGKVRCGSLNAQTLKPMPMPTAIIESLASIDC